MFQRQAALAAELGVADRKGGLQPHHAGGAVGLVLGGVGGVVGADAADRAVFDALLSLSANIRAKIMRANGA